MRGHSARCRIKTGRSSHVVGGKADDREAEPPVGYSAAWWISQRLGNSAGEFSTGKGAEQDGAGNEDGGLVQSSAKSPV